MHTFVLRIAAAVALTVPLAAQSLVADINTLTSAPGSAPGQMAQLGSTSTVLFAATVPGVGRELFAANLLGTGAQLLADIAPGAGSSNPVELTTVGPLVLFFAVDAAGNGLWRTDGTAAGTFRLQTLTPYSLGIETRAIHAVGTSAFVFGDDGVHGTELWFTDGTVAGTHLVVDMEPGPAGGWPFAPTVVGSELYYAWNAPFLSATRQDLVRSNGSAAGTIVITSTATGGPFVNGARMGSTNGVVLFSGTAQGASRAELWVTNGTAAGTSFLVSLDQLNGTWPDWFTPCGTRTAFLSQGLIYISDGTIAGTVPIQTFPQNGYPAAEKLVAFGSDVCFYAQGTVGGVPHIGLWRSNGGNATFLADLRMRSGLSPDLVASGASLYLQAVDVPSLSTSAWQLWTSDGTPAGTHAVRDIRQGFGLPLIQSMVVVGTRAAFAADDGRIGLEPWRSDGTTAGTTPIADLDPTPGQNLDSAPASFLDVGARTLFAADDGGFGSELHGTDGTAAGTTLVADVNPGGIMQGPSPLIFSSSPATPVPLGDRALYMAIGQPWITDGTAAGTRAVPLALYQPQFTAMPPPLAFDADTAVLFAKATDSVFLTQQHVWIEVRPSGATAHVWATGNLQPATSPWRVGNQVLFGGGTSATGQELRSTAGWSLDINPGTASSSPGDGMRVVLGGIGLFSANGGPATGIELWRTDGTPGGTALFADLVPGAGSSSPHGAVVAGNLVFFAATTLLGTELWRTDGTLAGTFAIDIRPGAASSNPDRFVVQHGLVYFAATDAQNDRELWVSDGTAAGTQRVVNLAAGSANPLPLRALGSRRILFTADDGVTGRELYESDGTALGTRRLLEVRPGTADPGIDAVHVRNDGFVLFAANDGTHGRELFGYEPGAVATTIGSPCGASVLPQLSIDDPVLGSNVTIRVDAATTAPVAGLVIGIPQDSALLGGCQNHVDLQQLVLFQPFTLPTTSVSGTQPVPAIPALAGLVLTAQVFAGPTSSPAGFDVSNAVGLRLGN